MKKPDPISPGEILLEEFLKPMGISQARLVMETGLPEKTDNLSTAKDAA